MPVFRGFFGHKQSNIGKISECIGRNLSESETVSISKDNDEAIAYFGLNSFPSEFFHTRETQTYIGS